jgi:hypothetical protein
MPSPPSRGLGHSDGLEVAPRHWSTVSSDSAARRGCAGRVGLPRRGACAAAAGAVCGSFAGFGAAGRGGGAVVGSAGAASVGEIAAISAALFCVTALKVRPESQTLAARRVIHRVTDGSVQSYCTAL